MPEARNKYRLERTSASTVPSVVDSLTGRGREWVRKAACAIEPASTLRWVMEPSGGSESPTTVIRCLEVCRWCPVRRECLLDALSEAEFTVEGVWGGTTRTERQRVKGEVIADLKSSAEPIDLGATPWGRSTSRVNKTEGFTSTAPAVIAEAARRLESTFGDRYATWIAQAQEWTTGAPKRDERTQTTRTGLAALRGHEEP